MSAPFSPSSNDRWSMKIRNVTFDTIRPFLKSSKSEPLDNAPYELERCRGENWWTIRDLSQFIVGQMTDVQVQRAIQPVHEEMIDVE